MQKVGAPRAGGARFAAIELRIELEHEGLAVALVCARVPDDGGIAAERRKAAEALGILAARGDREVGLGSRLPTGVWLNEP